MLSERFSKNVDNILSNLDEIKNLMSEPQNDVNDTLDVHYTLAMGQHPDSPTDTMLGIHFANRHGDTTAIHSSPIKIASLETVQRVCTLPMNESGVALYFSFDTPYFISSIQTTNSLNESERYEVKKTCDTPYVFIKPTMTRVEIGVQNGTHQINLFFDVRKAGESVTHHLLRNFESFATLKEKMTSGFEKLIWHAEHTVMHYNPLSVRKTSIAEVCKAVKDVADRKKIVCAELETLRNMSFVDIEANKLWSFLDPASFFEIKKNTIECVSPEFCQNTRRKCMKLAGQLREYDDTCRNLSSMSVTNATGAMENLASTFETKQAIQTNASTINNILLFRKEVLALRENETESFFSRCAADSIVIAIDNLTYTLFEACLGQSQKSSALCPGTVSMQIRHLAEVLDDRVSHEELANAIETTRGIENMTIVNCGTSLSSNPDEATILSNVLFSSCYAAQGYIPSITPTYKASRLTSIEQQDAAYHLNFLLGRAAICQYIPASVATEARNCIRASLMRANTTRIATERAKNWMPLFEGNTQNLAQFVLTGDSTSKFSEAPFSPFAEKINFFGVDAKHACRMKATSTLFESLSTKNKTKKQEHVQGK